MFSNVIKTAAVIVMLAVAYVAGRFVMANDIERSCMHDQRETMINGHAFYCVDFYQLQQEIARRSQQKGV